MLPGYCDRDGNAPVKWSPAVLDNGYDVLIHEPWGGTMKLEDVHNRSWEERIFAVMVPETLTLAARQSEFFNSNCPACQSEKREQAYLVRGMQHQRCLDCRTLYISPCPTDAHIIEFLTTSEATRIWREEMPEETRERRKPMYQRRLDAVLEAAEEFDIKPKIVVEVGGGGGEFAAEAAARNAFDKLLICEPQPLEINLPNTEVVAGSFDEVQISDLADIVVAFEVFEHLVEPDRFLSFAMRNLRPGGLLFLTTPK